MASSPPSLLLSPSFRLLFLNFLPSLLILILPLLVPLLLPKVVKNKLRAAFGPFLMLAEIYPSSEDAAADEAEGGGGRKKSSLVGRPPLWKTVLLVGGAGIQGLGWIAWAVVGSLEKKSFTEQQKWLEGTIGVCWVYLSLVNLLAPSQTVRPRSECFLTPFLRLCTTS